MCVRGLGLSVKGEGVERDADDDEHELVVDLDVGEAIRRLLRRIRHYSLGQLIS